jgi:sugar lactone lactonase YvrE
MNLKNDVPLRRSALSFVVLAMVLASSCSTSKDMPALLNGNVDFSAANKSIKVEPVDITTSPGNEQISVDVGNGVKTGASISFKLNLDSGENFKTQGNKDGNPAFTAAGVKSLKVWLIELDTGSSPITAGASITPTAGYVFSYDNLTTSPTVTFKNVKENKTTPQQQSYYVAVAAYKDFVAAGQSLSDNITNTKSGSNRVMISGSIPAAISAGGGDGAAPLSLTARAGSVIVSSPPNFTVSSIAGLTLNLKLLDETGATIAAAVTAQSGTAGIGSPNIVTISGFIDTIAGNGTASPAGDGAAATLSSLNNPNDVAVDSSGNIFISDTDNCKIRRIDVSSGKISTVAGTGTCGNTVGGTALTSDLDHPKGIAIDTFNNIYVADFNNHIIRKFAPGGNFTTIAGTMSTPCGGPPCGDGGDATSANLKGPVGIAFDSSGNLYIADKGNHAIRKVDTNTPAKISKIAGTYSSGNGSDGGIATTVPIDSPEGVAVGSTGNIYFSDTGNHIIRKVVGANIFRAAGNISHASGNGGDGGAATSAQLADPSGITFDKNGNFYISDNVNQTVRKVNISTGIIKIYAGIDGNASYNGDNQPATSAQLQFPKGVFADKTGFLYIADAINNRVRKVF